MTDPNTTDPSGQVTTESTPVHIPNTGSEGTPQEPNADAGEGGEGNKTPWYIKVISQRAHEAREARREANTVKAQNAELLQQLAVSRQNPQTGTVQQPNTQQTVVQPTQAEIDARVNAELSRREFDKACNDVWAKGNKELPDFKQSLDDTFGVVKMTPGFLQTVVALQEPHKILYNLSKNPEEAHRIMSLNPQAQAIELARLESKTMANPVQPVSGAPAPIRTVEARRASGPIDLYDTANVSTEDWMRVRSEQKRHRIKA